MGELTTRETLFELMKVLNSPVEAIKHPVEPAYDHDPWPTVRMAVAVAAALANDHRRMEVQMVAAREELRLLKELMR